MKLHLADHYELNLITKSRGTKNYRTYDFIRKEIQNICIID